MQVLNRAHSLYKQNCSTFFYQGADYNKQGKIEEAEKLGEAALVCDLVAIVFTSVLFVVFLLTTIIVIVNYTTGLFMNFTSWMNLLATGPMFRPSFLL